MSTEDDVRAVLFTDVCGSTRLYERLGDEAARSLVSGALSTLEAIATGHRGTVIKSIGDELMCTFADAADAVDAAIEMNRAADRIILPGDSGPLRFHTGVHLGPVVANGGDVFGDAVNVAARVVSLAKPRQILTTGQTIVALRPAQREMLRCVDRTALRGKSEEQDIHEVVWEWEEATVLADSTVLPHVTAAVRAEVELSVGDRRVTVDLAHPSANLGRLPQNDVVVLGSAVSRYHARVERRRGKFVLIDQSSNGTFLTTDGRTVALHRDEAVLEGAGLIGLGEEAEPEAPTAIRFSVRS